MREAIRAVLFDKDGTLIDSFAGWISVNRRLFDVLKSQYGGNADHRDLDHALGMEGDRVVPGGLVSSGTEEQIFRAQHRLLGSSAPPWAEFLPEIRTRTHELFLQAPPVVAPLGDVKAALLDLRSRGYRLGVATSDSHRNAVRDLADLGGECIEFWATSDRLAHAKPHPESVTAFSQFVGVAPGAIAFVGDSTVDLQAARAGGVGLFIAVESATCPPEVLTAADAVVDTVEELAGLLGR